ncbi:MAG: hypothetical protein A3B68_01465 [Candidatus Melainabacteria bacterium RIFCSPHIGHO2_02_FULL_34_12]|nr:MAG: hypothetical protein A3B68_01465 [Candidatus Melainabacteria bacterium RIFCSPHIGHO2_02_FULL_34_12]
MNKIITILFLILFLLARADSVLAESLVTTIPLEYKFDGILANPKTNKVYILSWVFSNNDSKHQVLDGETGVVIDSFRAIYHGGRAALNPDTNRMYLTSYKKLNVVDLNTNTLITSIDFDDKVVGAYVNPKTNKIYVNLYGGEYDPDTKYGLLHKGIAIIDGNNNQIIKTLLVDELYPFGTLIKFDNISNLVYVGRFNTNTLHVFDSITDTLLRTENLPFIYTAEGIKHLEFNEREQKLYITTTSARLLSLNSSREKDSTGVKLSEVHIGNCYIDIAVNPDTNKLYVTEPEKLVIIDCSSDKVLQELKVPVGGSLAINPNNKMIYEAGLTRDGERLFSIIKDDDTLPSLPLVDKNDDKPALPVINKGNNVSLSNDAKLLLYKLIASMKRIKKVVSIANHDSREVMHFAKMIIKEISLQSENCSPNVFNLQNEINNEIIKLGEISHPVVSDELRGTTEKVISDISMLLKEDNNKNEIADICEANP